MYQPNPYAPYTSPTEINAFNCLASATIGQRDFKPYMVMAGIFRHRAKYEVTFGTGSYPAELLNQDMATFDSLPFSHQVKDTYSSGRYGRLYAAYSFLSDPLLQESYNPPKALFFNRKNVDDWVRIFLQNSNFVPEFTPQDMAILGFASIFSLSGYSPQKLELHENDPQFFLNQRGYSLNSDDEINKALSNIWHELHSNHPEKE